MSEKVKLFHQKLEQLIEDVIAPMGRYQYALLFILCFNNAITAIANVVTTFYSYQPDFFCGVCRGVDNLNEIKIFKRNPLFPEP